MNGVISTHMHTHTHHTHAHAYTHTNTHHTHAHTHHTHAHTHTHTHHTHAHTHTHTHHTHAHTTHMHTHSHAHTHSPHGPRCEDEGSHGGSLLPHCELIAVSWCAPSVVTDARLTAIESWVWFHIHAWVSSWQHEIDFSLHTSLFL